MQIIYDEKLLRKKCTDVINSDNEYVKGTIINMTELILKEGGLGLSAPQVGIYKNFFIIKSHKYKKIKIFINPKIIYEKGEKVYRESCLSIKNTIGMVKRDSEIKLKYYDGKDYKEEVFKDFEACQIQHEMDHLQGILFTDRLINNKKEKPGIVDKLYKYISKVVRYGVNRHIRANLSKIKIEINNL